MVKTETENFAALLAEYESENKPINIGQSVEGTIVDKTSSSLVVDFGHKSLGYIKKEELKQTNESVDLGDSLKAKVLTLDNGSGQALLSYRVAREESAWEEAEKEKSIIPIKVTKKTRNGLVGDFNFINVFIPNSLVDLSHDFDSEDLVGTVINAMVVRADRKMGTIIASRRDVQVSEHEKVDIDEVNVGDVYPVKITRIMNYGAFVYFGGLDGLIHISDVDWGYVEDVNDYLKVGQDVDAVVVSKRDGKVSFGLKQNNMKKWDKAKEIFKEGEEFSATVKVVKRSSLIVECEEYESIVLDKNMENGVPFHVKRKINKGDVVKVKFVEFDDERNSLIFGMDLSQIKKEEEKRKEDNDWNKRIYNQHYIWWRW